MPIWKLLFLVFLGLALAKSEGNSHVMFVGDSVDRYAVVEWCLANDGVLCSETDDIDRGNHIHYDSIRNCSAVFSNVTNHIFGNLSFHQYFSPYRIAEVNICYVDKNLSLSFIFNKNGVTNSVWHCHHNPQAYGNISFVDNQDYLKTMVDVVSGAVGLRPTTVLAQSSFWDLAFFKECDHDAKELFGHDLSAATLSRWINDWKRKAAVLFSFIRQINPQTSSFVWRSPNDMKKTSDMSRWYNHNGHLILNNMLEAGFNVASRLGYAIVDFHRMVHSLRDDVHPGPKDSANLTTAVLAIALRAPFVRSNRSDWQDVLLVHEPEERRKPAPLSQGQLTPLQQHRISHLQHATTATTHVASRGGGHHKELHFAHQPSSLHTFHSQTVTYKKTKQAPKGGHR